MEVPELLQQCADDHEGEENIVSLDSIQVNVTGGAWVSPLKVADNMGVIVLPNSC